MNENEDSEFSEEMNIEEIANKIKAEASQLNDTKIKIALFGQPGSGKSSLINAITGEQLAEVGVTTDKTTEIQRYEWNHLILVDLPGYDTKRFPKETFFKNFDILSFDLFLCVYSGKFREADNQLFHEIKSINKVCIFVRNQRDMLWQDGKSTESLEEEIKGDLFKQINSTEKLIFTSCKDKHGIDSLKLFIEEHLDEAKKKRWIFSCKVGSVEFLNKKREIALGMVSTRSWLAAVNGLNPIPLADVAVDIGLMIEMTVSIRECFGLDEKFLVSERAMELTDPSDLPILKKIIGYGTKKGILYLLQKFATRQTARVISKFIPIVGSVVGAGIGYAMCKSAGNTVIEECYDFAKKVLEREMELSLPNPNEKLIKKNVKIDKIIESSKIFVDTCFLMHSQASSFFEGEFLDKLVECNKKIYLISKVESELKRLTNHDEIEKKNKANQGLKILDTLRSKNLIENYREGNQSNSHADAHFLSVFTLERAKSNLCLLTQDAGLSMDICNLENQKSVESKYKIQVCFLKKGQLKIYNG